MNRRFSLLQLLSLLVPAAALLAFVQPAAAQATRPAGSLQEFYDRVRPAVVAVKYQWDGELAKEEVVGCGIVVRGDGLVMVPLSFVSPYLPDEQMKSFKILVPVDNGDPDEVDAAFVGRDERTNVGFVQAAAKSDQHWTFLKFQPHAPEVGQSVYGVGVLPKVAGYKAYLTQAMISAKIRGEQPQLLVSGALGNVGSAVFDENFTPIGVVGPQEGQELILDGPRELNGIVTPPHFFVPADFFLSSIDDPPIAGHPIRIPWIGVPQMTGVNQQFSDFLGLKNRPAVQIGDIVPGTAAARAGLEPGNIIVAMNGHPLERGDLPEELPLILRRHLMQMKVGDKVTFTVLSAAEKDAPTHDVTVTMDERPKSPNQAKRFYAQDLGFVAREAVFTDTYAHKMKADAEGVVIDLTRRDGAAATAKIAPEDWILQLNGQPVKNLAEFRRDYQAFRRDHPRDEVVLVVHRRSGQEETINIEPPQSDAAPGNGGGGGEMP